jgi:ATP/maltotriose-dependent transcriptional regulator MalT/DNA-binding SARP family transcriptional activator
LPERSSPVPHAPALASPAGHAITRPELSAQLNTALDRGAVLLVAGAGFGKTMALEQALATRGEAAAWVRCGEAERDAGQLLARLVRALGESVPGATEVLAEQLGELDPRTELRTLLGDLEQLLVDPVVVVIDDAEKLGSAADALGLVEALLHAPVPGLRVAVASRTALGLRVARLRVAARLAEFGPAELAFNAAECAQVLAAQTAIAATETEVNAVMAATEGWPLGVVLSGLAGGIAAVEEPRARDELFEYLAQEVLDALDEPFRREVLRSSLPEELTAACRAALGLDDRFAGRVSREGLMLRELHHVSGTYRWHPLMRAFLLDRARDRLGRGEWPELHAAVAAALASEGRTAQAIGHWLEAGRWFEALEAMAGEGVNLLRLAPGLVRTWLDRLPADVRSAPLSRFVEAQLAYSASAFEESIPTLIGAMEGFRAAGDAEREWQVRRLLVPAFYNTGRFADVVDLAAGFDDPQAAAAGSAAPIVALAAAEVLSFSGRAPEADALFERAVRHPAAKEIRPLIERQLAVAEYQAGQVDSALERVRRAASSSEEAGPLLTFMVQDYFATLLAEVGDDEAALEALGRAIATSEAVGLPGDTRDCRLMGALVLARAGRLDEAEAEAARAPQATDWGWYGVPEAIAATIAAARGQAREALAAADAGLRRMAASHPNERVTAVCWFAPVLGEIGELGRAMAEVESAFEVWDAAFAGERGRYYRARLLALRAWLLELSGDSVAADAELRASWSEAGESVEHVLRPEWPRLEPLVWRALERGVLEPGEAIAAVLAAFADGSGLVAFTEHPTAAVRRAALLALLTARHPEVLGRLAGLSRDPDGTVAAAAQRLMAAIERDPPPLRFRVLGGFEVRRGSWPIPESAWRRPIAARLVRFLLIHRGAGVVEDVIFEALWPGKAPDAARHNLHVAASQARAVLDLPGSHTSLIQVSDRAWRLELAGVGTVDADTFLALATAALDEQGAGRRELLERAAAAWTGAPLPEDRYAQWAEAFCERLLTQYREVLAALAVECRRAADHSGVMKAAGRLIELDPLDERAHRDLMVANARAGRPAHALRQFLTCRRALRGQLGIEPAPETRRLYARILAHEPV